MKPVTGSPSPCLVLHMESGRITARSFHIGIDSVRPYAPHMGANAVS